VAKALARATGGVSRTAARVAGERRDPQATRRALVAAATRLFAERGFDAVPIGTVAAEAGVNKALISYHFGGKRGLYRAILTAAFADVVEGLKAVEAKGGDPRRALSGMLATFARVRGARPEFPALFLRELLSHGIEPAVLPYLGEILGVTRRLAERGMRDGVFRRVDPVAMHLALVGSLVYFLATESARNAAAAAGRVPRMPRMPRVAEFLRYLEELTLRGLRPDRRTSSPTRRRKGARA
jgi:TetR/AcrR family transcriptional regulator